MYYRQTKQEELTRAQMDMARKGFRGKLVRLRFSPQFIVNNADDLLSIAHTEYVRAIEKGVEVEDPVAWTIHCAWRRTQNLLQAEKDRPRIVSSEKVMELVDEDEPSPDETTLEADRARKIREAVEKLSEDQRKVVALTFFEGFSVREAASYLSCSPGKVQHHRDMALAQLRRLLPVKTSDELDVDFGMVAWLAIAAGGSAFHLPAGFEALLDRAGHGASGLWARAHDLARRFTVSGTDAAGAVASSGAGRAAGVCATGVAVICLAGATTGIVGPGVGGGLGAFGGDSPKESAHHRAHPPKSVKREVRRAPRRVVNPIAAAASSTEPTSTSATTVPSSSTSSVSVKPRPPAEARRASAASNPAAKASAKKTEEKAEASQVEKQTSGFARAEEEAEAAPAKPPATASDEGSTEEPAVVTPPSGGSKGSSSSGPKSPVCEEFCFEK